MGSSGINAGVHGDYTFVLQTSIWTTTSTIMFMILIAAFVVCGVSSFPHAGPQGYQSGGYQPAAAPQAAAPAAAAAPAPAPLVDGVLPHKMEMKPFVYMGEGKEPEQ